LRSFPFSTARQQDILNLAHRVSRLMVAGCRGRRDTGHDG
jgi:hypothetical protein